MGNSGKSTIVVLGMHRSGTSALTRVLSLGGAELPQDLTEAVPGNNEKGFFESRQLLLINIRIMNALNFEWWSTAPLEAERLNAAGLEEYRRQIRKYASEQMYTKETLLLKDPRMCRLFPMWRRELRKQGGVAAILALRDPRAVAASLFERDGIPNQHGQFLWLRHMLEAERHSRSIPRQIVAYEDLMEDWVPVTERIAAGMAPVWTPDWSQTAMEVDDFLEGRLTHHQAGEDSPPSLPLVKEAYELLSAMARGDVNDQAAQSRLDDIGRRLDDIDSLVGPSLGYTTQQYLRVKLENMQHEETASMLDDLKQDLAARMDDAHRVGELESELRRLQEQADQLRAREEELGRKLEDADGRRRDVETSFKQLQGKQDSVLKALDLASTERDEANRQLEAARKELETRTNEYEATARALANAREQRDERADALRRLEGEHAAVEKALENARAQRDEHLASLRKLEGEHESIAKALANARDQRDREIRLRVEDSKKLGNTEAELRKIKEYAQGLQEDRDRVRDALAEATRARTTLEQQHESLNKALDNARRQRDEKDAAARQLQGERDQLSRALDAARAQRNERESALRELQNEYGVVARSLERARQQRDASSQELAETRGQLDRQVAGYRKLADEHVATTEALALSQRQREAAMDQVARSTAAVTELQSTSSALLRSRASAAERAMRYELFEGAAVEGGAFNIWARPQSLLRDDRRHLWDPAPAFGDAENWTRLGSIDLWKCARAAVRRRLFDVEDYKRRTGVSASTPGRVVRKYLSGGWRDGADPSAVFDSDYYCRQAFGVDTSEAPGCPLVHYLLIGAREGLSPHPLFDADYYRAQLPHELRRDIDLFSHYLNSGWQQNLDPHWAFCVHWYLSGNADVREAGIEPLTHYLSHGDAEGRSPHPFVNLAWYRRTPGVEGNAMVHFVREGLEAGRSTHPLIDVKYLTRSLTEGANWFRALMDAHGDLRPNYLFSYAQYRVLNRDVSTNPLVHYLEFGWKERRRPHILFDPSHYDKQAPVPLDADPLAHYLGLPAPDRPSAHPMIDLGFYGSQNPDLAGTAYGLYQHFVRFGGIEGRNPCAGFDCRHYMSQLEMPEGWNALEHYLLIGRKLGLDAKPKQRGVAVADWSVFPGGVAATDKPAVLLVAHVATGNLFGSERSFLDMVEGLHATGLVDVVVALPQDEPAYISRIAPFVSNIYVRPYPWWDAAKKPDEGVIASFDRLLEAEKRIAVVHVNTMMLREPLIAARRRGLKAVVHVREILDKDQHLQDRLGLGWKDAIAAQHEMADHFICNSLATQRLYPDRSFVVPNTIDVRRFAAEVDAAGALGEARYPGKIVVGMISSNLEKKGIGDFIGLARAAASEARLHFLLIGPDTPDLQQYRAAGLPDNLTCTGYIERSAEAIAMLDVVVNFSHFAESFGRTVLEAMAAARPVVVYDHGALPYLVEEGQSGFVIPYRDFNAALPLITRLVDSEDLRAALGARGHQLALGNYDTHCYVSLMRDAYEAMLGIEPDPPLLTTKTAIDSTLLARVVPETEPVPVVLPASNSKLLEHEIAAREVLPASFEAETSTEALKIAYFQWHFPVPSETFVLNELRGLVADGYDVTVFCRQSPYPDFEPDFRIEWERVDTADDLAEALKRTGRTIVHSHFTYPTVTDMVWPACESAGLHFTFCAHAQDIFKYDNDRKNRIAEVVASRACRAVFVPGRFHRQYLLERGVPASKIVINPQGVDTTLYPQAGTAHRARGHRRIAAVHRFTQKKGFESIIRAAPRISRLGVQIDLWGYGEDADAYRALVSEVGADNVEIHEGVIDREQMIRIFETSDAFLAPCIRAENGDMDGIPTVVMEAMLCGVPVITTNVASLPELVMDGHTGLVCEPDDPDSFAAQVERLYGMPDVAVERMIEEAESHVRDRFDVARLMRMVRRVWQQQRLDIVLVTWNNLPELREVITRLFEHTHLPFHLLICDNDSESDVTDFLGEVHATHDNVTLIHKGRNSLVGPGTNTAAARGSGEFVVYVCGKEGFVSQPGWDSAVLNYMIEHPAVGVAGTLCYSPTYLHGRDYPTGVKEWPNFRNQQFALDNPDRIFCHVQGGLFAMRRAMLDEIGGFSDDVPHSYTDVEFSYFVESSGWQLGEIPHVLALFNKTRPDIVSRMDESIFATHPPMMEQRSWLDSIANRTAAACNLCGWQGEASAACPNCGAQPVDRTLYRMLAESLFTYRRLPAIAVGLGGPLEAFWKHSFQGAFWDRDGAAAALARGALDFGDGRIMLNVIRDLGEFDALDRRQLLLESHRTLDPLDGELWIQTPYWLDQERDGLPSLDDVRRWVSAAGFDCTEMRRYSSSVIDFDPCVVLRCKALKP